MSKELFRNIVLGIYLVNLIRTLWVLHKGIKNDKYLIFIRKITSVLPIIAALVYHFYYNDQAATISWLIIILFKLWFMFSKKRKEKKRILGEEKIIEPMICPHCGKKYDSLVTSYILNGEFRCSSCFKKPTAPFIVLNPYDLEKRENLNIYEFDTIDNLLLKFSRSKKDYQDYYYTDNKLILCNDKEHGSAHAVIGTIYNYDLSKTNLKCFKEEDNLG